jgi:hypothetical protein
MGGQVGRDGQLPAMIRRIRTFAGGNPPNPAGILA